MSFKSGSRARAGPGRTWVLAWTATVASNKEVKAVRVSQCSGVGRVARGRRRRDVIIVVGDKQGAAARRELLVSWVACVYSASPECAARCTRSGLGAVSVKWKP